MGKTRRLLFGFLFFPLLLGLFSCEQVKPARRPPLVVAVGDSFTQQPIEGATCVLLETTTLSDSRGRCRFEVWAQENTVIFTAPGYQRNELSLTGVEAPPALHEVVVDVPLLPDHLEGTVRDAYSLEPIAYASVHNLQGETVQSDEAGQFTLQDPQFPITLTVLAPGYEVAESSFHSTTVELFLRPNTLHGQVQDRYSGEPLSGAVLTLAASEPVTTTTDTEGRYHLDGVPESFLLRVEYPRYRPEEFALEQITQHDVLLRPAFLEGVVRNEQDGQPLAKARVIYQGQVQHTDLLGHFSLEDVPEELELQVLAPGFAKSTITIEESSSVTVDLEPFAVQGIYVTSFVVSTYGVEGYDLFTPLLDFVEQTELNAMVIEAKDAWGTVAYNSQLPLVQELDTASPRYDVQEILEECRRRGIYTIAYIVTFEDSWLVDARPEWGVQSAGSGVPWTDRKGLKWADPYRREVWDYNISIARELAELGFDEVQFDYIRFPTDGSLGDVKYAEETSIEKQYDTIAAFVEQAYNELTPTGAFVSADVFGYAAWRKMWEQGQDISLMTHYLDYICPMSYPSHYTPGELGCANPNACPYEIVLETLNRAHAQMTEGQQAKLRPWVQDFDLGAPPYGPLEVQAQILASWDAGGVGWCLWNAGNVYTQGVDYSPQEETP
jgi:hypothetical protein